MKRLIRPHYLLFLCSTSLLAQGTKQWNESRFEQFEKGDAHHVAIRNDGRLEAAPALTTIFSLPSTYVWSIDASTHGDVCAGTGAMQGGASVLCSTSNSSVTELAHFHEAGVQALRILPDGSVLVATAPDGKLYRLADAHTAHQTPTVLFDPATTAEKPKYLWSIVVDGDVAYLAAGAPAAIYKVSLQGGGASLYFKPQEQHIRSLLVDTHHTLYAGTDGSGIVYRITPDGKPFALYTAKRREITALVLDPAGTLYLAAVGTKAGTTLPPLSPSPAGSAVITIATATAATPDAYPMTSAIAPEGSEIDAIHADGTPAVLSVLKDDIVYSLAMHGSQLLAATGNRGRIYEIDTQRLGTYTDLARTESGQVTALFPTSDGTLAATSNNGKILRLANTLATDASFTSDMFDARIHSTWGRVETESGSVEKQAPVITLRTGNTERPQDGTPSMWSDWSVNQVPSARYAQWKATLTPGTTLSSISLNYLQSNLAPQVDAIIVQSGARVMPSAIGANTSIAISFTPSTSDTTAVDNGPLMAEKKAGYVTARWQAHDDNQDPLLFALYYRDLHEHHWHLLHDHIRDRFYSFDASLLPDSYYQLKVVATDRLVHPSDTALQAEAVSDSFLVDTTAPVPGIVHAHMQEGKVHVTWDAQDALSPIVRAEYSLDAGPWQYLEPVGKISDEQKEHYDFSVVPSLPTSDQSTAEHIIAIRVYDRFDNSSSAKAIVQ